MPVAWAGGAGGGESCVSFLGQKSNPVKDKLTKIPLDLVYSWPRCSPERWRGLGRVGFECRERERERERENQLHVADPHVAFVSHKVVSPSLQAATTEPEPPSTSMLSALPPMDFKTSSERYIFMSQRLDFDNLLIYFKNFLVFIFFI